MPEFNLNRNEVLGKPLGRVFTSLERVAVDPENERVIQDVALATDAPIYQWFGAYVILDMAESSIRMDRMKASGAALWCHDRPQQIGRWQGFRIEKNKLRADCKFSRGQLGDEKLQDVKDDVLVTTSVGFSMYDIEPEIDTRTDEQMYMDGTPVFRCKDWEPFECSWEPIPADIGAGTNRALDPEEILQSADKRNSTNEERTMPNNDPNIPNPAPANTQDPPAPAVETRSAEQILADNRLAAARTVLGWADVLPATDAEHIRAYVDSVPLDSLPTETGMREYLQTKRAANPTIPVSDPATAATRQGGEATSIELARSIPRSGAVTAFDRGSKDENLRAAFNMGCWALSTIFRGYGPEDKGGVFERATKFALENGLITRALAEGSNAKGGYLVPEQFSNDLIDLVLKYGVFRRNANVVQMTSDTMSQPRFVSGPTAYFVNESQPITESDLVLDRVTLVAKKLASLVVYSSELNEDAIIDIGNLVADKTARAFAKKEDECGFLGNGSSTHGGMIGVITALRAVDATIANIKSLYVGTGNTYAELIWQDFVNTIGAMPDFEGAADDRMKWYMNKGFYYNVVLKAMFAANGNTMEQYQGMTTPNILGYPVEFVNVMPNAESNSQIVALFGDLYATATMGVRREFTFTESEHVRFIYDDIVAKATERFGINVHSVGDTTLAGPMMGLITAAS